MLIELDQVEIRLSLAPGEDRERLAQATLRLANQGGFQVFGRGPRCIVVRWAFGSLSDAWVDVAEVLGSIGIPTTMRVVAPSPPRSRSPL